MAPASQLGEAREALVTATTLGASGDTYVQSGLPNRNVGGDTRLSLQLLGRHRPLLFFTPSSISAAVGSGTLVSARVELTLASAASAWGLSGRNIAIHRLKQASSEYQATWNCAVDANVNNLQDDCSGASAWNMASTSTSVQPWLSPATATRLITTGQTGVVSFDVTTDVAAILAGTYAGHGWLLKKVDENQTGSLEFVSREQAAGPRLLLDIEGGGGSTGPGPVTGSATLVASADSYVRQGLPNQNFGTAGELGVQAFGRHRALVAFDPTAVPAALQGPLVRARLRLPIANTADNWGPDRAVGAHRLRSTWTELGATWNCAVDSNTGNITPNCSGESAWEMLGGSAVAPWQDTPTGTTLVSNGQAGALELDVTRDVACALAGFAPLRGWLIKKERENQSGRLDLRSRESVTPPQLLLDWTDESGVVVTAAQCNAEEPPPNGCTPLGPLDSTCNGIDDDCDGEVDDDYAVTATSCGTGACAAVGESGCVDGQVVDSCSPGTPAANDAACNLQDDDCNGIVDEDYVGVPTSCGVGACASSGLTECVLGSELDSCEPSAPAADDASCDGIDEDCDGSADEGYAPLTTSCGVGACAAAGSTSCVSGQVVDGCTAGAPAPADATCNFADDDCDGAVDEDFAPTATSCGVGACGAVGTTSCVLGAVVNSCQPGAPAANDADCDGSDDDCDGSIDEDCALPPNPAEVATPVELGNSTTLLSRVSFLFQGNPPVQTGVQAGAIVERSVAVLRGRVLSVTGEPLPLVQVAVQGHPELGSTFTRGDGGFDLVVNGGGEVTVRYSLGDHIDAARQVRVPWQDFVGMEDVVLVEADAAVTVVDLPSVAPQVHQATPQDDADGIRQANLLFAAGTEAELVLPDGSSVAAPTLSVRATEFTVGPNGPRAMPAILPPTSGYTYAVELSADEAVQAGAAQVRFSRPVVVFVDNFLGFPVGDDVPVGSYDPQASAWIPEDDGRVIEVLDVASGLAELDVDGSGVAADAAALALLGVSDEERAKLAQLYPPGTSLWRVQVTHFTAFDCNWPRVPDFDDDADDAADPIPDPAPPPEGGDDEGPGDGPDEPKPQCGSGSIIEVQSQTLGERVDIAGTPFALNYRSSRQTLPVNDSITIPVTGPIVANRLQQVELKVEIQGQRLERTFAPSPNQSFTFSWDGRDGYGRKLTGEHVATITVTQVYPGRYAQPGESRRAFAQFSATPGVAITGERDAGPIAITSTYRRKLTARHDYRVAGIGGWLLDEHHTYDPVGQALYLGSGERRDVALEIIEQHALLVEQSRGGMAVTADGTVYVSATVNQEAIYRMVPGAAPVRVAGGARPGCTSSLPGPASSVCLSPITLDAGPDGNIYFWNDGSQLGTSILRLDLGTATVSRVAGTGPMQCSVSTSAPGDGGLAVDSPLCFPRSVAVASDGTVYIYESDTSNGSRRRIRKVTPDGIIQTVFLGPPNVSGDSEVGFDVGPDGSVYAADLLGTAAIWRLLPSGVIERFAGTSGSSGHSGDGGPALLAKLGNGPSYLLAHTDGRVFIVDDGTNRTYLRVVDQQGFIQNLIGSGTNRSNSGNNGPALKAGMHAGPIAIGPNNLLYLAQHVSPTDTFAATVRTVSAGIAGPANGDVLIPSLDGLEVYRFARNGRHLETLHSLTSSRLYGFSYDSTGRLESITDRSGNVTQFERDAEGAPTGILGPFGHHTQLTTNDDGLLASVRDPSGAEQHFGYAGGLLTSHTDVRGGEHSFEYDTSGRLIRDENAVGGGTELARATVDTTTTITRTSAEGVQRLYRSQELPEKDLLRTEVDSDGSSDLHRFDTDGTEVVTGADGTVTTLARNADPRWKMQSPLLESRAVRLPSGLTNTTTEARTVTLASASDLLSLRTYTQDYVQNGSTDRMSYSSTNRTVTLTSAAGRLRTTVLDPQGRPTRLTRASLLPTDLRYDSRGRFDRLTSGDRIVQRFFDASSNLSSSTDPLGIATTFDHDPIGRLTALHRVDGSQLLFTYDAAGHVTSATPPGRPAHLFTWTLDNLLETYTEPDAGAGVAETTYVYDLDGRLEQTIYPDGSALTAARDALNHVTQLTFPTGNVTFEYFAATACTGCSPGRLKAATADGVRVEQAFNGLLKTSTTSSGPVAGRVAWTYDNNFRPITETVTAGTSTSNATFTYDTDDLPTCVSPTNCTTPGTGSLSLGYDTAGQPTSAVIGSLSESFTYNTHGERATHTVTYAGNPLLSTTYDSAANPRDRMGRVAVRAETLQGSSHTRAYGYDTLGRLETVTQDGVLGPEYVYDPNGNRESASNGSTLSVGTYDARDRLLSYGNLTFTYGANGQLATQQNTDTGVVTTYQYDLRGSLRSVTLPGTAITYLTDAHGRRVSKRTNGALVQRFLYKDGLRVSAELNATGGIAARFYYAGGNLTPDLMIKGTTLYRFIKDELGSPRLLIDVATGVITQQLDYDAFGVVTLDSNPGFQPFGFAGGLYDRDTKLVRFGARDYAAALGRWTTKDPLLWQGAQSNLYVYANNDPVNLRDPQGTIVPVLVAACALGGCEAVAGALATAAVWTAATLGAAYTGIELGRFLSRKFDIEQIDWIADKYGLDRDQRRRLHDEITRQDLDMDGEAGIEAIAADMAKSGRKPRPVEPERDPWDEDDGEEGGSCE